MALADICGLNNVMKRNDFSLNSMQEELKINSGNIENNYQLAMPSFANVS